MLFKVFIGSKTRPEGTLRFPKQKSQTASQKRQSKHNAPKPINVELNIFSLIGRPIYRLMLGAILGIFVVTLFLAKLFQKRSLPHFQINLHLPRVSKPKLFVPKLPNISFPKFYVPRLTLRIKINYSALVSLFLLVGIVAAISGGFYWWILKDLPTPDQLATRPQKLTTQIFDRNGKLLYKFYKDQNRTLVKLNDVPLTTREAVIAIEDKNFYQHPGLSLSGMIRAFKNDLTSDHVEGGSTITQQLVKNTLLTSEKSLRRKIKELLLSIGTELTFSKDQILQMYLNTVGFGGPAYGIQEAAQQYFGKNVSDLDLAESALLAGLPQSPTKYSPFGAHPEAAKQRQKQVLDRMVEDHYISQADADNAFSEPLHFQPPQTEIKAPHFVMYVKDLLVDQFGERAVEEGGLQVTTSLDLGLQEKAQQAVIDELKNLQNMNVTNGAALITQPFSGQILAMVGSKDYFDITHDGQVNLTTTPRQPGSSVKPINYAVGFEHGLTAASIIDDSPITFQIQGSAPWTPRNYDGTFHGHVTVRTALASSYNIPAIKVLSQNGVTNMADMGRKLGITTWNDPSRLGLSLTLGSVEVKMTDMAEAYGTFANLGTHIPLNPVLSITDSTGKSLTFSPCANNQSAPGGIQVKAFETSCTPQQVVNSQTAYLISDILSDNSARAPAFGVNSVLNIPQEQVAVKTGTSNDLRDNWTFGYTNNYLVATWVGNNNNSPMSHVASGITGASPIWNHIFRQVLANQPTQKFDIPNTIVKVPICTLTGTLTCSGCPNVKVETFAKGTEPQTSCSPDQIQALLNTQNDTATKPSILPALSISRGD